jgi:hypothetical protein
LLTQCPIIPAHRLQELRISPAKPQLPLPQEPPRHPTQIILGTDIGPGPDEDLQPLALGLPAELGDVILPAPVELPRLRLVLAPEDISADGVQADRLGHLQAMLPVLSGDAGGVEFASKAITI